MRVIDIRYIDEGAQIRVNGAAYVVVDHSAFFFHSDTGLTEMVVFLVKASDPQNPAYQLRYFAEEPEKVQFYTYDKTTKDWYPESFGKLDF